MFSKVDLAKWAPRIMRKYMYKMNTWNELGDRADCFFPLLQKYQRFLFALLIWSLKYTTKCLNLTLLSLNKEPLRVGWPYFCRWISRS